ncbi:MAG TPA: STT3 domain-containing protein [Sphingobium sp.]|uniref:STT3 domain-containing protein n=1 Tax=Sphingobium sp. TaxID=1912891 RepID=UPI002ED032AD
MSLERVRAARVAAWGTALIWLLCAAVLLYIRRYYIATMNFGDPDDALRLVEVRNWMAGQSWFDVTQYRIHPPTGAPMHWSRLVDVPIAFFIRLYGLFATPLMAERLAMITVPLLMLGALMAIVHRLAVRMTGNHAAGVVAAVMLATSMGVLLQFQPLRIDHHGWQITLGLLAIWFLIGRSEDGRRSAMIAALVMAVDTTIALEGLPLAVALGGVLALRYLRRPEDFGSLFGYMLVLGGAGSLLLFAMLGWSGAVVPWCDSLSPAYLLPLLGSTAALGMARRIVPQAQLWQRLACLAIAAGAGALLFARGAPQCMAGPFSMMDPLVYRIWYLSIKEGMPVWTQAPEIQILIPLAGILGLIGTLLAIRYDAVERRARWIELLIAQCVTFALSLMVMRAMGVAHVVAMPGNAWLFLAGLAAAMRLRTAPGRVLLGFCCFVLTPLGAELVIPALLLPQDHAKKQEAGGKETAAKGEDNWDLCVARRGFEQLNRIPAAEILTPLDIGSHILAFTHHSVMGTGHHRNITGMKTVISAFISDPDEAHAIIAATPARYVGFCPTENEVAHYANAYPHGLMAALMQNRPPSWLQPVPMERKDDIRLYKVVD